MRTVYRYPLALGAQTIELSHDAQPLFVGLRGNTPTLWAALFTDDPVVARRFMVAETGTEIPAFALYVGTYQQGSKAFHVFEVPA